MIKAFQNIENRSIIRYISNHDGLIERMSLEYQYGLDAKIEPNDLEND